MELKVYQIIRANGGWDNWIMIEIEKYPCKDGNEARARERYYFDLLNATMNMIRPFMSDEERDDDASDQKIYSGEKLRMQASLIKEQNKPKPELDKEQLETVKQAAELKEGISEATSRARCNVGSNTYQKPSRKRRERSQTGCSLGKTTSS